MRKEGFVSAKIIIKHKTNIMNAQNTGNKKTQRVIAMMLSLAIASLATFKGISQSVSLDLKKSIELALLSNGNLKADSLGINEASYQNKELAGLFLPQVN